MVYPIVARIQEYGCYSPINELLDPLDFLVPVIGCLDPTDVELEISFHNSETAKCKVEVVGRWVDVQSQILTPFSVTQKIGE